MRARSDDRAVGHRHRLSRLLAAALLVACGGGEASEDPVPSSGASSGGAAAEAPSRSQLPPGHPPVDPGGPMNIPAPQPGDGSGDSALSWLEPPDWIAETPANSMRWAQYRVPGTDGEAECVVYYFGPGQGGDARSNAERWAGQFTQPDGASSLERMETESIEVNGIPVLVVEVTGTYSGGMMSGPPLELEDHMLLGAIAEGPDANWFFKLTGPASTVRQQREAFMTMIRSLGHGSSFT